MFDTIKAFFQKLSAEDERNHFEITDHRLAAAALLVHVMNADGFVMESETDIIRTVLKRHYDLSDTELEDLIADGEEADHGAVDFYTFTSVLKRNLDREGRMKVVEMMWEVVLADGIVHELEDTVVWRVAELLGVETRERVSLRKMVEERLANPS
ncbi:MAG: TerB family tellurite resistance protein [Pseudomonadota bacterium]